MRHPDRSIFLAAGVLAIGAFTAMAQEKSVPILNPSFESGRSVPEGWRAMQGNRVRTSPESTFAWDREIVRTGQRSLYIRKVSSGPLRWVSTGSVPVAAGRKYRLEVWYRMPASRHAVVAIGVVSTERSRDGRPWGVSRQQEVRENGPEEWRQIFLEFTPPPEVSAVQFSLSNGSSARDNTATEVWFDDISLILTENQ